MPDIVKLGKSIKRCLDGILGAIRSTINSVFVGAFNNKIPTAFQRFYGFKAGRYRDTIIFLVVGGLTLPPEC